MQRATSVRVLMMLAMALVAPAYAQTTDLTEVFSGKTFPLSIKLKELDAEWRRMKTSGTTYEQIYGVMRGGAGVYYTKGQTVAVGSETYLIVYGPQTKDMSLASAWRWDPRSKPLAPEKLTADTVLTLSLLNLKTTGSLQDLRPFNLEQEIAANEAMRKEALGLPDTTRAKQDVDDASLLNLRQLGVALRMYAQDYDETLPPMNNATIAKKALQPYVKSDSIFVQPETKQPYQPNPVLSHKKLAHIKYPTSMIAFYEATPASDGRRSVAFVAGNVARIPESQWQQWKRTSKIP